jgi:hypothetical protein
MYSINTGILTALFGLAALISVKNLRFQIHYVVDLLFLDRYSPNWLGIFYILFHLWPT